MGLIYIFFPKEFPFIHFNRNKNKTFCWLKFKENDFDVTQLSYFVRGRYHFAAGLQFDCIGLSQTNTC